MGQDPPGFQEEPASSEGYTTPHTVHTPHQVKYNGCKITASDFVFECFSKRLDVKFIPRWSSY